MTPHEKPQATVDTATQATSTEVLDRAIGRALDGVGIRCVYQPLVELHSSRIVGHEALLRVDGLGGGGVELLFRHAAATGRGPALEAAAIALALANRPGGDGFLAVNVSATSLLGGAVESLLRNLDDLRTIVFEISGGRVDELCEVRDRYHARGARFSLDDETITVADLRRIMALRPAFVKLDRAHFEQVAHDEATQAFIEAVALIAARVGGAIVAEGIEHPSELQALRSAGVALGQGFLLGRPGSMPTAAELARLASLTDEVAAVAGPDADAALALLVEGAVTIEESELARLSSAIAEHVLGFAVLVNEYHEPLAVLRRRGKDLQTVPISVAPLSGTVARAGRIALGRPPSTRFEPMVVVDDDGRFVGVLRLERLLGWLANDTSAGELPRHDVACATTATPTINRRRTRRRRHRRC
ncbi:MAG: EAL domain-containing protein [Ilumatobacteraceae bacterium]